MKRIFITNIVPENRITKFKVSPAGNYFSYNLIKGKLFSKTFSLVPIGILDNIEKKEFDYSITPIQHQTVNLPFFGKFLRIFMDNLVLIFSIKKNTSVWFYNLTKHNIFAFLVFRFLRKNVSTNIIVLDFTPSKYKISLSSFFYYLINKSNGIITLSDNFTFSNPNQSSIAGVVPSITNYPLLKVISLTFLLSGFITIRKSAEKILRIFSQLPDYELHITGITDDEQLMKEYDSKYENIHYHGLLSYDSYLEILGKTTFCLNTRDSNYKENEFNFPSKIIEHLLYNKIIVSSMEYNQLENIKYFNIGSDEKCMLDFFKSLKEFSDSKLFKYANQSKIVKEIFGIEKWREVMVRIDINNLNDKN